MSVAKDGQPIIDLDDWSSRAGPKSKVQWADGRSAMEVARAWLGIASPALPPEVASLLRAHPAFGEVLEWSAEPEVQVPFDEFRGEPRNTDLLVEARDAFGRFVVSVEAKADEPFGDTVTGALASALERRIVNPRSKGLARIEQLACRLFGERTDGSAPVGDLRYQLITATAGALTAAADRSCDRAVLLVHEFRTDRTDDQAHASNRKDLDAFVRRLSRGSIHAVGGGGLVGPFEGLTESWRKVDVKLFVGKCVRELRSPAAPAISA